MSELGPNEHWIPFTVNGRPEKREYERHVGNIRGEVPVEPLPRALFLKCLAEDRASVAISRFAHAGESYARVAEGFCLGPHEFVLGAEGCIRCKVAVEIAYAIRQHARAFGR